MEKITYECPACSTTYSLPVRVFPQVCSSCKDDIGEVHFLLEQTELRRRLDEIRKKKTRVDPWICPYCKIEMSPTGGTVCNMWWCEKCNHERPEMGSYKISGNDSPIPRCECKNCSKNR